MFVIYNNYSKKAVVRKNKSIYFKTKAAASSALTMMSIEYIRARPAIEKSHYSVTTSEDFHKNIEKQLDQSSKSA